MAGAMVDAVRGALAAEVERIVKKRDEGKVLSGPERQTLERWLADQEPGELELERQPVVRLGTQVEVAKAYGYSIRQVKNWVKEGRKAGLPCPYERPGEMPAWFEVVFAPRECPERLRSAVQALLEGAVVEAEEEREPEVVRIEDLAEGEVGFQATLRRALEREALLDRRLRAALERGDPRADAIESQWGKAAGRVRELEKAAPSILEAQGVFVRRADVKASLLEIAGVIPRSIRMELRRRWRAIRAAETLEEFEAEVSEGLTAALRGLCESRFADPLELEVAS